MSFDNIPVELKQYPQWCLWRYEETDTKRPTKVPYAPNFKHMSVTDPETWSRYDDCLATLVNGKGFDGLGFIFTDVDPFAGIDLDQPKDSNGNPLVGDALQGVIDRQLKVYQQFDSYTEWSPSGKGLHIIIKATLPAGRRRSSIELYSSRRFFTMTGNVYNPAPINDRQGLAELLYNQMGNGVQQYYYDGDAAETYTDEQVIEQALAATNGDKFNDLLTDAWQAHYQSQSEADFAFIDIIAFYTQNRKQIQRIFLLSPLGARKKAKRVDYLNSMINKSFDQMLPPLDMDGLYNQVEEQKAQLRAEEAAEATPRAPARSIPYPRGLVGEVARFVYSASPRPVPAIAIAAAIGLMAGICGRSWNVSGTGLNLYTLLLAPTGTGKEAMSIGLNRLVSACASINPAGGLMTTPSITKFIGPSELASGQALIKELATQPSFVSIVGEFGLKMQQMSSMRAMSNDLMLKRILLSLYGVSGKGQVLGRMAYSDKEKNVAALQAPAFSILAESTPETFLRSIDESVILDGLLPRFLMLEYSGDRVPLNEGHKNVVPSFELSDRLGKLVVQAHSLSGTGVPIDVQFDPGAQAWADDFDKFCTAKINATKQETVRHLWNRAHLKLLRLSALIAVGVNPYEPVVTQDDIAWSYHVVNDDIVRLISRFDEGLVGIVDETDAMVRMKELFRIFVEYDKLSPEKFKMFRVKSHAHDLRMVPLVYLQMRTSKLKPFSAHKLGATGALKQTLADLIGNGSVLRVPPQHVKQVLESSAEHYKLLDHGLFGSIG